MINKIHVIGITVSGDPLTEENRRLIAQADVLVGGRRHLSLVSAQQGRKIPITADVGSVLAEIDRCFSEDLRVVVLATGDPLLFGIGNTLIDHFGQEAVAVEPGISAPQVALSRLGMKTHQAVTLSRHGARHDDLRGLLDHAVGIILTSHGSGVGQVAREVTTRFPWTKTWRGHVCQCLGTPQETIDTLPLARIAETNQFKEPNLLVVENPNPIPLPGITAEFGRPDEVFIHKHGLITHPEVRAITLSKLRLPAAEVLWDVGAGSGAVGIEAGLLNPYAQVFAVEKNGERIKHITANIEQQGAQNVTPIHGDALAVCSALPCPNRVFIGGGGASLPALLDLCHERLLENGIMVVNTITIESFETVHHFARGRQKEVQCMTVQISRMQPLASYHAMKTENPITIFEIKK